VTLRGSRWSDSGFDEPSKLNVAWTGAEIAKATRTTIGTNVRKRRLFMTDPPHGAQYSAMNESYDSRSSELATYFA
jgi:hypothetical protein